MTAPDFPRVRLPGGPYGFPPMLAVREVDRTDTFAVELVDAALRAMHDDLRQQAAALDLDLRDLELTVVQTDAAGDFANNRITIRAEATLRRPRP